MSNLSDLLPAGGGAKVITATADGNLATGQTVILQSDGTVKAVEATAAGFGSAAVFEAASTTYSVVVYDSYNDKIVVFYSDAGDSNKGKAAVGTVTGNSISWGTAVQFSTGNDVTYIGGTYDPDTYKVIVVYRDGANSNYGTANVGTVSGTSISFGTKVVYESANVFWNAATYETAADKVVVAYRDAGDSNKGKAIVGTVSGTSISFGSATDIDGGESYRIGMTFDSTNNKVIIIYQGTGIEIISGTVSGTSISFGTSGQLDSSSTNQYIGIAYSPTDDKFVAAWHDSGSSGILTIQAGNTSGSGFAVGSAVTVSGTNASYPSVVYDSSSGIFNVAYQDQNDSSKGYVVPVTLSGTTVTTSTPQVFGTAANDYIWAAYNSSAKNTAIVYKDQGNSSYGTGIIWANAGTTSDNFVGITNQAINNSASGEVVVEGGVITNGSLLPLAYTGTLGSEAVFQTSATEYTASCYDPDSNKTIIAWRGTSNYGYAVVATPASDNSITYGTPVAFSNVTTKYIAISYDTGQDKVLIVYQDDDNSDTGKAIVGTVSGTSISFGTAVSIVADGGFFATLAYSPDTANHLTTYNTGSNVGKATVLTVSGTSVSVGSTASTATADARQQSLAYDTTANKYVLSFQDVNNSYYGAAVVISVSGTTPSVGTQVTYNSSIIYDNVTVYDPSNDKTIIAYKNGQVPTAVVGTVSGTSISFGDATVIAALAGSDSYGGAFDTTSNVFIFAYRDEDTTPDNGNYAIGTVSGTSISFGTPVTFNAASTKNIAVSYNANINRSVITYRDEGNSNYGTGIVLQLTGAVPNFTIGSTYYVQDDGTLGTGSTSVTAGKAIANTTLLLKG